MLIVSYEYINTDGNFHKRTVTFTNEELFKKWVAKEERKYITGIWKIEDPATNEVYTAEELETRVKNAYLDGRDDAIDGFLRRIFVKYTEYEREYELEHTCADIKDECAEIAKQMKEQKDE